MCGQGCIWKGSLLAFTSRFFPVAEQERKVRVVQHKQTKDLYALKYINKTKCVKMKAVPNVIQERRLLEEVPSRWQEDAVQALTAPVRLG